MIRFAQIKDKNKIIKLWHNVFGDDEKSIEYFFGLYYGDMIIYEEKEEIAAMLTMLPVTLENKKGRYIYAVATDERYRCRGLSTMLLNYANKYIKENGEYFSVLVPAEENLFAFYEKRGYTTVECIEKCRYDALSPIETEIEEIAAEEYKKQRKEILRDYFPIEWGAEELENICRMYNGQFCLLKEYGAVIFCYKYRDILIIKEACCDKKYADNIAAAAAYWFGCRKVQITLKGKQPFAMVYPAEYRDIYFNIAID